MMASFGVVMDRSRSAVKPGDLRLLRCFVMTRMGYLQLVLSLCVPKYRGG